MERTYNDLIHIFGILFKRFVKDSARLVSSFTAVLDFNDEKQTGIALIKFLKELINGCNLKSKLGKAFYVLIDALATLVLKIISEVVALKLIKRHITYVVSVCLILAKSLDLVKRDIAVYVTCFINIRVVIVNKVTVLGKIKITLNNVNVYAGGTKPGTDITYLASDATSRKRYTFALYFRGAEDSYFDELVDNVSVKINGGKYKAIGSDGCVMYLRGTSAVVTDGTFVGEDMTYVAWVYNYSTASEGSKNLGSVTSSLSVHDGLFIRPVYNGGAVGNQNPDAAVGAVIDLFRCGRSP